MNTDTSPDAPDRDDAVDEAEDAGVDPRDTEHPTGTTQAAENAAEESPS